MNNNETISQGEAAIYLGVSPQALTWMSETGKITAHGRPRRYRIADVIKLAVVRAAHPTKAGRPNSRTLLQRRGVLV